jgi:predicted ATPase
MREMMEPALNLAIEHGESFWEESGTCYLNASLAHLGDEKACRRLHAAIHRCQESGKFSFNPFYYAMLADACRKLGKTTLGLTVLEEAFHAAEKTLEGFFLPELHRLRGELLQLQDTPDAEVETYLLTALDLARSQSCKWHELLAAKSLARFRNRQGRLQEAYDLLHGVYSWFTEGFELKDMREARALLEEWSLQSVRSLIE